MKRNSLQKKTVLFCGPIDNPLNSGRYMIEGMEQLGYKVIGYDYRTSKKHEEDLLKIVENEKPLYIFTLKGEKLSLDLIERFKESGCITILWFTMLSLEDWMAPFARAQDFVLTNVEDHVDYFSQRGIKNIKWIHQGFSPELFEIDAPGPGNDEKHYADVAMIGSMGGPIYNRRCGLVMQLRRNNIDIKWWGPHLSRQLKNIRYFSGGVHRAWTGKEVYMKDFADVIRNTKIFIGEDADIPVQGRCLSNRSFAVMGCGGFYLCRRTAGVEFAYDVGKEIDVFDTDDEMVDKVRYYLKNEEERKRIALAGQKKVFNNYTYKNQIEKIFNWVNEHLGHVLHGQEIVCANTFVNQNFINAKMKRNSLQKKTVLFCGPIDNPLNSGRYMIEGMEQLGYKVIGYDYRTSKKHEEDLLKIVENEKPLYIFTLKGEKLSLDLIERFKESGCITILWFTMLSLEDWMAPFARAQDFVLTNVEDHVDYFSQRGIKNIKWIHQGFSPELFEIDAPGPGNDEKHYADVAMIGSMGGPIYNRRCGLVMQLRRNNIDIKWWGPHLSRQLKNIRYFSGGVHRAWAGKEVYMKDFADVIRNTKIFIGEDADIPVQGRCLSNRSFAVMGCGGFYLCRRTAGVEFAYDVGKEIDVFDTDDEMIDKVRYYLKNEEERKRIALAGQKKVLNNYTYKNQIEKMFNWVNEHL